MFGIDSDIIVIIIAVILLVLIFKLISEFIVRLIVVLLIAGIGFYFVYFHTDFFEKHKDNMIIQVVDKKVDFVSVFEFQDKFCSKNKKSRTDEIICECIIQPLVNDLKNRFSAKELRVLEKDKTLYLKEIIASLKRNKKDIMKELKNRDAEDVWDNLLKDLRTGKFLDNYTE